jgi:hypothetical protein
MQNTKRFLTLLIMTLAAAAQTKASAPTSWIDVVGTYGADPTCTVDSGPAINNAIAAATAPGSVLFFQTGCYLILTEIFDRNTVSAITYLGYGNVTLQAGGTLGLPAILQLGDATHPVSGRRISNLVFNCRAPSSSHGYIAIDGIDIYNLSNSVFEDVQIINFGGYGIQAIGNGSVGNTFKGGIISTSNQSASGVSLAPGCDNWTFVGTIVTGSSNSADGSSGGVGINVLGSGFVCVACSVGRWNFGITAGLGGPVHGLELSGGSYEAEGGGAAIRIGGPGDPHWKAYGVSIHGAAIAAPMLIYSNPPFCVDLEQVNGFSIVGNTFSCDRVILRALADDNQAFLGADNGVVGPNDDTLSGSNYQLQGRDIAFFGTACSTGASPANCGFASSGTVAIPAGAFTLTVNDPFVTATSRIAVREDMTLGPELGITCNTVGGRTYSITNKTPGTSFAVTAASAPAGNPACLTFHIEN